MLAVRCNPSFASARPLADLDQIMQGFFAPAFAASPFVGASPVYPAVNLWHDDTSIRLEAELPGFKPEDLDITVQNDEITLRGSRAIAQTTEGARAIRQERASGAFERAIRLPFPVNGDKAAADFKNGVLTLTLPKPAEALPRKVRVKTND
jgi:HSP20 family protein